jgi:hypothetical protein
LAFVSLCSGNTFVTKTPKVLNCQTNMTVFCFLYFHAADCVHKIFIVFQGQRKLVASEIARDIL